MSSQGDKIVLPITIEIIEKDQNSGGGSASKGGGGGRKRKRPNLDDKTFSTQPVPTLPDQVQRGGIHPQYEVDPGVKGFQKRKQIRGAVERFRDDRSKSAHASERYIFDQKRLRDVVDFNSLLSSGAVKQLIQDKMQGLSNASVILSNPQGFVGNEVLQLLGGTGPHGAAVVAAIAAIVVAPEVIAQMIQTLSQKGLPLNRDWERFISQEVNAFFNTEDKKKRLLGHDAFIVTQGSRYIPETGSYTYNSLENRDEIITSKVIGHAEKAVGIT